MCVMAGGGKFGANEVARLSIQLELYRKKYREIYPNNRLCENDD